MRKTAERLFEYLKGVDDNKKRTIVLNTRMRIMALQKLRGSCYLGLALLGIYH